MRSRISITLVAVTLILSSSVARAQKSNKFEDAQQRAQDAARIITLLGILPESDLPRELVDRAQAIAVFPKVTKQTALLTSLTQGFGVISARTESGWTMPAFYRFAGGSWANPFGKSETTGLVLLFMSKDAIAWLEKGGIELKDEKRAIEGPVGALNDEQRKQLEGAHLVAYAYFNGKLSGKTFDSSFWKTFVLNPDNNINSPLYGMKGRDVLAGVKIDAKLVIPATIPTYTEALHKYYSATKTSAANQ